MKSDDAPFYLTRVECPVCKTVNEFETIKLGAYTESGRDTDFRPTGREWRNPRYQGTDPLLYFTATCSSCFYSREFNRKFREWKNDAAFRTHRQSSVRQRHLAALANDDSPIKRLGAALWSGSYPIQTAINKLLLSILCEQQCEQPSDFDVARWYLRVAWLFRGMESGTSENPSPRSLFRGQLTRTLADMKKDTLSVCDRVNKITALIEEHPETLAAGPDDTDGPAIGRSTVQHWDEQVNALLNSIDEFIAGMKEKDTGTVIGDSGLGSESYGDYPSYASFLAGLRTQWPEAPTCEAEALALSLKHYQSAYREGRGIEPGNPQIQLAYMIGELARRTGDYDESQRFLNQAMRLAREWVHKLSHDQTKTAMASHIIELAREQLHNMAREMESVV